MEKWKEILANSITDTQSLAKYLKVDKEELDKIVARYPMRINPYYLGLIKRRGDPIWKQCVPDVLEIQQRLGKGGPA